MSDETVDAVCEAFQRSPGKSTHRSSNELRVSQSTVVMILHKRLKLYAYEVQIVQSLQADDGPRRPSFATENMHRIDKDNNYLKRVCFSDEATFHTSGVVNRHNVRIWGSEKPHVVFQSEQGSPKENIWCGLMHNKVIGPFFFNEPTISANVYWTCWNFTLHLRRVSAVDNFPTRWCNSTLGFRHSSVFGCNISRQVDWERWSNTLATTIAGYHPP